MIISPLFISTLLIFIGKPIVAGPLLYGELGLMPVQKQGKNVSKKPLRSLIGPSVIRALPPLFLINPAILSPADAVSCHP